MKAQYFGIIGVVIVAPYLPVSISIMLSVACLGAFLYYLGKGE